jgi:hypothetical protein
LAHDQAKATW